MLYTTRARSNSENGAPGYICVALPSTRPSPLLLDIECRLSLSWVEGNRVWNNLSEDFSHDESPREWRIAVIDRIAFNLFISWNYHKVLFKHLTHHKPRIVVFVPFHKIIMLIA